MRVRGNYYMFAASAEFGISSGAAERGVLAGSHVAAAVVVQTHSLQFTKLSQHTATQSDHMLTTDQQLPHNMA